MILYPSSLPSSTVGGLLAQGGTGFGGYEFGVFKENVLEANVILPDGDIKTFTGSELQLYIADMEGITGIITKITMKVRELEPEVHRLISFRDNQAIGNALSAIYKAELPIWSITFLNPESMRLKRSFPTGMAILMRKRTGRQIPNYPKHLFLSLLILHLDTKQLIKV